ncbi:MAG: hypothetical protein IAE94_02185 [Chthoniobacterales bacterium]|nr:hypothetical protein [Chthoniobacterales bacterium]
MFALKRLLLLLLIVLVAYCFWPRKSSLTGFDPVRMSELQMEIWKSASGKKVWALVRPFYSVYQGQYQLPPISAMKISFDSARALHVFHTSPDAADQEKALAPLQTVFQTMKSGMKAGFDSNASARMELMIWMLRADHAKRAQLTTAWSESLAMLYGRSTQECLPAAKKFAVASKFADEGKWGEAQANALEAWRIIGGFAPPEKK